MVTTLGTILGTTLGTELGGMQDVAGFDSRLLYALTNFSAANYYATQAGGGEAGVATGFVEAALVRMDAATFSAVQMIAQRMNNSNAGHQLYVTGGGAITASMADGGGVFRLAPTRALTASDVGKIHAIVLQHDGAFVRLWVDRLQAGAGTAITGFTASATAHALGSGFSLFASGIPIIAALTARGVPSQTQLEALYDAVRTLGDVPSTFPGATVTHRWSLRDVLAGLDLPVIDGQTAPASLPDTVTAASVDAMARQGSPTVRVIDPGADGRKTYGALGFSATNLLQTAAGIRGASAFTVGWFGIANALDGTNRTLVSARISSDGYRITHNSSSTSFWVYDGAAALLITSGAALPAGVPCGVVATWSAGVPKVYVCTPTGVVETTGTAGVAGYTPSAEPFRIGDSGAVGDEAINATWFGSTGMDGAAATLAQVQAWWASVRASGRIQAIGGAQHTWDAHADITANGGPENGVPATVQDRIGTDHLTRVGGLEVVSGGVTKFTATNTISTPGGVRGDPAGFWAEVLFNSITGATDARVMGTVVGATSGWSIYSYGTAALVNFSDGAAVRSSAFITIADNTRTHIAIRHTGTAMETYVNGTLSHTATFPAVAAAAGPMYLGAAGASSQPVLGGSGGDGVVPTPAEIATAAAAALAAGKVVGIPGKTPKRWSIADDVTDAGGKVPAIVRDRVGTDHAVVVNTKLEVAQRAERVWSYEATPIMHGVESFTDADTYSGTTGAGGDVAGFAGSISFMVTAAGASATRFLAASNQTAPSRGWDIRTSASNATISMAFVDNTNVVRASGSAVLGANAVGKIHVFSWCWDAAAGRWRVYLSRAEVGTGTTATGYAPTTGPLVLGNGIAGGLAATGIRIFGLTVATGIPTLAVMQAHYDAVMANDGRMVALPGLTTQQLIDVTQDAPSGGTAPATLTDRSGNGNNLTKNGSPTLGAQYARAFGW